MNLQKLMKQAQQMQAKMAAAQEELAAETFETTGAGGKIKVTANGSGEIVGLEIDPAVIDPDDAEFLSDLVLKTVQEALETSKAKQKDAMNSASGGLAGMGGMPGF